MVCIIFVEHALFFFWHDSYPLSTLKFKKMWLKLRSVWLLSFPPSHRQWAVFPKFLDMRQHSQSYCCSLAPIPRKCPKKLYSDRWCTRAKCGRLDRCRQTLTVPTVKADMFVQDYPSFSSHCQGTDSSMHNHAMFSLSSDSTTPKWFAILLTDIKNQFSRSLGENHKFIGVFGCWGVFSDQSTSSWKYIRN